MSKIIKILGANKNVRKNFSSIKAAKQHIDDKKLVPAMKAKPINIEVTTVKLHKVDIEVPELPVPIKTKLIQVLKDNVQCIEAGQLDFARTLHDIYMHNEKTKLNLFVYELVKSTFNVSDDEMQSYYERYSWDDGGMEAPFADKLRGRKAKPILKEFINEILKTADDISKIEFLYIQTDYKPCHNISVVINDETFQIRKDDIRFREGFATGRNVRVSKISDLTEETFEKFFKTTTFSKVK